MSNTNKVKKLPGVSRYEMTVNGQVFEIQKRDEKSPYGDIPWDIHTTREGEMIWVQTFGSKKACVEYLLEYWANKGGN